MGAISSTVVTLSKKAEQTAVTITKYTMIRQGSPLASLAALYARYSNSPDCFATATNSIMPISTPSVLKSMASMPWSKLSTPVRNNMTAPANAADVLWTFSVTISAITAKKTTIETICSFPYTRVYPNLFITSIQNRPKSFSSDAVCPKDSELIQQNRRND